MSMNILQMEDMVKGLPDDRIMQELQQPSGQMPEFLLLSERQRRETMRASYANQQQESMPTIKEQIIGQGSQQQPQQNLSQMQPQLSQAGQGITSLPQQPMPQQPPAQQQMMSGGLVRMAGGGAFTIPYDGQNYTINSSGYPNEQTAFEAFLNGNNDPLNIIAGDKNANTDVRFNPSGSFVREGVTLTPQIDRLYQGQTENLGIASTLPTTEMASKESTSPHQPLINRLDSYEESLRAKREAQPTREAQPKNINLYEPQQRPNMPEGYIPPIDRAVSTARNLGDSAVEYAGKGVDMLSAGGGGTPFTDTVFGLFDSATEGLGSLVNKGEELWNTAKYNGHSDPVEPEKKAQAAAADSLSAQGGGKGEFKTLGGNTPESGDPDVDAVAGLEALLSDEGETEAAKLLREAKLNRDDLVAEARKDSLDVSELTKQAQKQAWGAALMELGAGIAGGDVSKGLSGASDVMQAGYKDARRYELLGQESEREARQAGRNLEMQGRTADYEQAKERSALARQERDATLNRALTKLGIDNQKQQQLSWNLKNANDEIQTKARAIGDVLEQLDKELNPLAMGYDEIPKDKLAQMEAYREQATMELLRLGGIDISNYQTDFSKLRKE